MIRFITDIQINFWISMICIMYIDAHDIDFIDAYPNPVLLGYMSKCLEKVNKYLRFWFS